MWPPSPASGAMGVDEEAPPFAPGRIGHRASGGAARRLRIRRRGRGRTDGEPTADRVNDQPDGGARLEPGRRGPRRRGSWRRTAGGRRWVVEEEQRLRV
jgi:hypothetical protein